MKKKKVNVLPMVLLPFVLALVRFILWCKTGNGEQLTISCLWMTISLLEYEVHSLKEKVNGIIH